MRTVCIVQARMGSKRLPGKVLLPLNGHTVIEEVLGRCHAISGVDAIVCAIPETPENDELERVANKYADVFRSSEHDVLSRYLGAANWSKADIIVRITGDCPLISPDLCGDVVKARNDADADYASNIMPRTFPQGLDCEVFTAALLARAERESTLPASREHVTPWMRINAHKIANVSNRWGLEGRLTLDTEDDYKVICAYFGHKPHEAGRRLSAA